MNHLKEAMNKKTLHLTENRPAEVRQEYRTVNVKYV